jgi:CDP-glucose 4,6-dehydratase
MDGAFWPRKRVLITGHTGFKGSWLSIWLQMLGAEVVGYALNPQTEPSLFELAGVDDGMISIIGDVRDRDHLARTVSEFKPEIVFHMAAQAIVRESYRKPVETYATNLMGTVHILDAIRNVDSVRSVVVVTSDKCYENREWVWGYREHESMGGYDPYSSSKGCAEIIAAAYRNSFFNIDRYSEHGVALATARAGNVIGGGDWASDRLVPDIIRSMLKGEDVIIRNPRAVRPWQHVLEPLNGYLTLAERLYLEGTKYSGGWNFGPYESGIKPVSWVVDALLDAWNEPISWRQDETYQPHEDNYLVLDCAKARNKLQWAPRLELGTALEWIVQWVKGFQAGENMRRWTESQIQNFASAADQTVMIRSKTAEIATTGDPQSLLEHAQLFDLMHETVMRRSMEGTISLWNRGAEEMYGWKREEAVGKVSHKLLKTEFPKPLVEIESELAERGEWVGKLVHFRRDGSRVEVKSRWFIHSNVSKSETAVIETNQSLAGKISGTVWNWMIAGVSLVTTLGNSLESCLS